MNTQLADARARAELGMQRAIDHANRVVPNWRDRALGALREFARGCDRQFTIEQARAAISIEAPPDFRSWGSVTQAAIRAGVIVKTNDYAGAASSNGSPKRLYVRGLW